MVGGLKIIRKKRLQESFFSVTFKEGFLEKLVVNVALTSTYGPGMDDILSMTIHGSSGTTNYYYLKDLANTVLALANSSGSIVESYVYDAYGNVTIRNGSGTVIPTSAYGNRFLFQGREYDYTTQLYHFRARWYDPETGRWLSNDPNGISGGLNLYAFCSNDPVNYVDPRGEAEIWISRRSTFFYKYISTHMSINIGNPNGKFYRYSLSGVTKHWYNYAQIIILGPGEVTKDEICHGDFNDNEEIIDGLIISTVDTDGVEQAHNIIAFLDDLTKESHTYSLIAFNCRIFASFVYSIIIDTFLNKEEPL
ncbi:MAG: RHS repeat-associated core domain-containing protein [Limisphaerales bacterium]